MRRHRELDAGPVSGGEGLLLLLLVAGTVLLRAWGVTTFPFEQDELYTEMESSALFATGFKPGIDARPLYYMLQRSIPDGVGSTEVRLRILPVAFGVAGVVAAWGLARWLFGPSGALLAGVLTAIAPWQLFVSGMARYWSLVFLLSVLFAWAYLQSLESDRRRDHLAALLAAVAGMVTHPSFLLPLVGAIPAALTVGSTGEARWPRPTRAAVAWFWMPLAVLALAFRWYMHQGRAGDPVLTFRVRGDGAALRLLPAVVQWATPVVVVAGGVALLLALSSPSARCRRWGAFAAGGVVAGLGLLAAAAARSEVYADYAIGVLAILLVATGMLVTEARSWPAALGTLAVVGAGVLPSTLSHLLDGTRYDFRPAFAHIRTAGPTLAVAMQPVVLPRFYAPDLREVELPLREGALDSLLAREGEFWLVAARQRSRLQFDRGEAVERWSRGHCRLAAGFERPRFDYRLYRVEVHRCGGA